MVLGSIVTLGNIYIFSDRSILRRVLEEAMKILVVDDDSAIRMMLRVIIENRGGEVVGEAGDGKEAIKEAERLGPDLILLDVSMPVMGGFQAARYLCKTMPLIPIIFVSQHRDRSYLDEAIACGAKGYVVKSAAASELPQALAAFEAGKSFHSTFVS